MDKKSRQRENGRPAGSRFVRVLAVGVFILAFTLSMPYDPMAAESLVPASGEISAKEEALAHKQAGERLIEEDDIRAAADSFLKAIAVYDGFSAAERLKMAEYISWDDRLGEALGIVERIIGEEPGFTDARLERAKLLGWLGRFDESIEEADRVLVTNPGDRLARLAKGNALAWQGDYPAALPIYESLLAEEEGFEARLGLVNAYIATGELEAATASAEFLEPSLPYQERELKKSLLALKRAKEVASAAPAAASARDAQGLEERIASLQAEIAATSDTSSKARLYKAVGDAFAAVENNKAASDNYIEAISLYDGFSVEERLEMGRVILWDDRQKEALKVVEGVLAEEPGNIGARRERAKLLSWLGRFDEAIEDADRVLAEIPTDKEARLIKANSLAWRGDYDESIPIYKGLLAEEESFDARAGLTNALIAKGKRWEASESFDLLRPTRAYQDRERERALSRLEGQASPSLEVRYWYYNDSEDNWYDRYRAAFRVPVKRFVLKLSASHTEAQDPARDNYADLITGGIEIQLNGNWLLDLTAGSTHTNDRASTSDFAHGAVRAEYRKGSSTVSAKAARYVMIDTAELIENAIRVNDFSLLASKHFQKQVTLTGIVAFRDYSDDNSAIDLQGILRKRIYSKGPLLDIGLRGQYMDFDRQSGGGYFDPNNYISTQVFTTIIHEYGRFDTRLEGYLGWHSYSRNNRSESSLFGGGLGLIGYKVSDSIRVEAHAEGGNYALGSHTGFSYYMIGGRLSILF